MTLFFFSSRRRHTRCSRDWSSDVCSSDLINYTPGYVREELEEQPLVENPELRERKKQRAGLVSELNRLKIELADHLLEPPAKKDRKSTRLNSSHGYISYAVFCLKKKNT